MTLWRSMFSSMSLARTITVQAPPGQMLRHRGTGGVAAREHHGLPAAHCSSMAARISRQTVRVGHSAAFLLGSDHRPGATTSDVPCGDDVAERRFSRPVKNCSQPSSADLILVAKIDPVSAPGSRLTSIRKSPAPGMTVEPRMLPARLVWWRPMTVAPNRCRRRHRRPRTASCPSAGSRPSRAGHG